MAPFAFSIKKEGKTVPSAAKVMGSSKGLAWGGPRLNSLFSFIGVGVAVEVWLHPCVGDRFPCVDDVMTREFKDGSPLCRPLGWGWAARLP